MSPEDRRYMQVNLEQATDRLQSALQVNADEPKAMSHVHRALSHVSEAYLILGEGKGRTIEQLIAGLQ